MDKAYVIFSFDMEADVGSYTTEYRGVKEATPRLLDIFKSHDAEATFLFTAKAAKKCPEVVEMVRDSGHEIGCHSYQHESLGPTMFDTPGGDPILPEEVFGRVKKATEEVEKIAGKRPVSFRAPRFAAGDDLIRALEKLGYLVDSSYGVCFHKKQLVPYHPSPENWLQCGDMNLLEIPIFSIGSSHGKDSDEREQDQWPKLRTHGAESFIEPMERLTKELNSGGMPAVFCFFLHPWEFIKIPEVLHLDEADIHLKEFLYKGTGERALKELNSLLSLLKGKGTRILTMIDFYHLWEAEYCKAHSTRKNR